MLGRLVGLMALGMLLGCSAWPEPAIVPLIAETSDFSVLAGDWWGEYSSIETGRSGRIRFSLETETETARGDVLMFPALTRQTDSAPDNQAPSEASLGGRTLTIRFVRAHPAQETVTGTLEPYEDPDCHCVVITTFTGRVSEEHIEGTFVTQGRADYRKSGRWRVDRR